MTVCWNTEDATKRRTWGFAADFCAIFDFVSVNHFFLWLEAQRRRTPCQSKSVSLEWWRRQMKWESLLFGVAGAICHWDSYFLLLSHKWQVRMCLSAGEIIQWCNAEKKEMLHLHDPTLELKSTWSSIYINVCGVNVWMCQDLSKVLLLNWLRPLPNLRKVTMWQCWGEI